MTDATLIPRHSLSDRLMHWNNAACWLLLLATGIGLVDHPSLAVFGQGYPAFMRSLAGGGGNLLTVHIALGCFWIASLILYLAINRKGAFFFLRSIFTPAKGDSTWLFRKTLQMTLGKDVASRLGVSLELPAQGYYNAGQRILAVAIVLGCAAIAASGLLMALSTSLSAKAQPVLVSLIDWALLVHHASVWLIVAGLFVHIYMAAISIEERPALLSMFTGTVPLEYAQHHHPLWDIAFQDNAPTTDTSLSVKEK